MNCKKSICEKLKPCDHLCLDTESSFLCLCRPGYILQSDQKTCKINDGKYVNLFPLFRFYSE